MFTCVAKDKLRKDDGFMERMIHKAGDSGLALGRR